MPKIAFVSNSSFSMYYFRKGVLKYFIEQGFEVHVIAPIDHKTHEVQNLGCYFHPIQFQTKSLNPFQELKLYKQFKKAYARIQPDLIFQYTIKPNIYGTAAAASLNIPSIAIITGLGYAFITKRWINSLVKKMYKYALSKATQVWFLNQDDIDYFINQKLVDSPKVVLLPGEGVNTKEFAPEPKQVNDTHTRFLMIARVLWDKGVMEYVEAAQLVKAQYPNVVFQLLGPTDADNPSAVSKNTVMQWHEAGYIQYLGTSQEVKTQIRDADCVVLPSYREGISKVLMEAASMAKPLIATNVAGCKELIIHGENGYLCEVKNAESLAQYLLTFIQLDEQQRLKMGAASRAKMCASFDEQLIIQHYKQTFEQIG